MYQQHEVGRAAEVRVDELCRLGGLRVRIVEAAVLEDAERADAVDDRGSERERRDHQHGSGVAVDRQSETLEDTQSNVHGVNFA